MYYTMFLEELHNVQNIIETQDLIEYLKKKKLYNFISLANIYYQ